MDNGILEKMDKAIANSATPDWAVPMLLCMRDDHCKLRDHLASHRDWLQPMRQVAVSVITALAIAAVLWLMAGRLPGVFGP